MQKNIKSSSIDPLSFIDIYFCGLAELMFLKTICNSVNVTRNPIPFMTIVVCSIAMVQIQTIKSALG